MEIAGRTANGDPWVLLIEGDPAALTTTVTVEHEGSRSGGGARGGALRFRRRINVYVGAADRGPRRFIARVAEDVARVVVTLSDGTREDLDLHGDPATYGCRVAALLYDRALDIHRVDLFDAAGKPLPDAL